MTARPYFLMTTGLAQAASGNRPNPFFASLADVLWMEADAKLNVAQPTVLHKPMPLPPSAVFRTLARVGGSGKIPSLPSSVGLLDLHLRPQMSVAVNAGWGGRLCWHSTLWPALCGRYKPAAGVSASRRLIGAGKF